MQSEININYPHEIVDVNDVEDGNLWQYLPITEKEKEFLINLPPESRADFVADLVNKHENH